MKIFRARELITKICIFLGLTRICRAMPERERTEAETQSAQMQAILDNITEYVVIYDHQGNILSFNRSAQETWRRWGYEQNPERRSDFNTIDLFTVNGRKITPDERPSERVIRGERFTDYQLQAKINNTGHMFYTSFNGVPVYDTNNILMYGILTMLDITKLKLAEGVLKRDQRQLEELIRERTRDLEEAKHQINDILESISDNFYALDHDLLFTYVNKSAERLLGKSRENLIGYRLQDVLPKHSQYTLEVFSLVVKDKMPRSYERFSEVVQLWVEISVYPTRNGISVYFRDISERKKAEEALRQSEERFYKAFQNSPDMMAILRVEDYSFIEVNMIFLDTFGYTSEEVINHTPLELDILADDETRNDFKMLINQGELKNIEYVNRTKSGKIINTLCSAATINFNGEACYLLIMKDITEIKRYEQEIARLDRLNLVGEMSASISHEIRNPLTTVRGYLQLLRRKESNRPYQEQFNLMIDELDRANGIITEFLSLSRDKIIEMKPMNLLTIVNRLHPLITADSLITDKRIKLDLGHTTDIIGDEKEIKQLILNLVRNGIEAMTAGGTLTIKTYQEDSSVVLQVSDQGKGISGDLLGRLGTPFLTTKENGTGLGLAVCYSVAMRHKAQISVETGSGGTTFKVSFPKIDLEPLAIKALGKASRSREIDLAT